MYRIPNIGGRMRRGRVWIVGAAMLAAGAYASIGAQDARQVNDATLLKPPVEEWVTYGRDYAETHHSPLKQIDAANVARLGLAWSVEVGSEGKIETTPLVWNGTLYGTSTWSVVYAVDIRTGKLKWRWDPALVRTGYEGSGPRFCC